MTDVTGLPLAETVFVDDAAPLPSERDRIVVLGRRASGKTVYLSVLYEKYWKSVDGLTMKAVSGSVHSDLVRVVGGLRAGQWPPATLETQHCDLEIEYKGRKHLLVALDYAGELFRKAFVEDVTETPETAELVRHIDSAAAVMLLIDPAIVAGGNLDAAVDDDFGMTQAVARIRNWPGGRDIPFVMVFTKGDVNHDMIHREGGLQSFVLKYLPALARTLQRVQMFEVAAVQAEVQRDGSTKPVVKSAAWQVEKPLLHCLEQIDLRLELENQEARQRQHRQVADRKRRQAEKTARHAKWLFVSIVASMIIITACIIALIWVRKS
jgi:hypothetical protein